jgi:menaquinone-dependent protoporphyrinogen oxidase
MGAWTLPDLLTLSAGKPLNLLKWVACPLWVTNQMYRVTRLKRSEFSINQMEAEMKVLVTYASKYGATAEIAEKIGQVLGEAGLHADVLPADAVRDLSPYEAVVLGSAVYIGRWRKQAVKFLKANETALAEKAVWLFSSGPTGKGDPLELVQGWRLPKALQPIADRIHARDVAVFHGAVDSEKLNFIERWMLKNVKAPAGDFRDWETITAWATAIADALKE